jgi:predicted nucleic acid binding AN1-type Zn finger protein
MVYNLPWQANSHSASHEFPLVLWNRRFITVKGQQKIIMYAFGFSMDMSLRRVEFSDKEEKRFILFTTFRTKVHVATWGSVSTEVLTYDPSPISPCFLNYFPTDFHSL